MPPEVPPMAVQLTPRDIAAADQLDAARASSRRSWSTPWVLAAVLLTVMVDVAVVWAVHAVFGPVGLVTCGVLAVGGLWVVATRNSTTSLAG